MTAMMVMRAGCHYAGFRVIPGACMMYARIRAGPRHESRKDQEKACGESHGTGKAAKAAHENGTAPCSGGSLTWAGEGD